MNTPPLNRQLLAFWMLRQQRRRRARAAKTISKEVLDTSGVTIQSVPDDKNIFTA